MAREQIRRMSKSRNEYGSDGPYSVAAVSTCTVMELFPSGGTYSITHDDIASLRPLIDVKLDVSEVRTQDVPLKLSF